MANIAKLKVLLASPHPVSEEWAVDAAAAAAQGNLVDMEENINSLSGNDLFTSTDDGEFVGLSDAKRSDWISWCSTDRDPFHDANVKFVDFIFGPNSATKAALADIRKRDVSLFQKEGQGTVLATHIEHARAYHDS